LQIRCVTGLEVDMKSRLIALAAVCLLIPGILLAQPAEKKTIVGVWEVKTVPAGHSQPPLLSLAMYNSDGSFTTSGGYKALPAIPVVQEVANELGPGYGRWAATGNREFRLTFYSIMWKEGLANAHQRVQETLVLSESGDEYTGQAQVDFLDLNWNVVFSTTIEVKGTRLETPAMPIAQPAEKNQLAGVWEVKVSLAGQSQSPQLSIVLYGADGGVATGDSYMALPHIPAVQAVANELGPGYGQWVPTNDREFRLTYYSVMWKAGLVTGYQRVQETLDASESGDKCTGHAQVDFLDANWKVVFSTTSDIKSTRLETSNPTVLAGQAAEKNPLEGVWAIKNIPSATERIIPGVDIFGADSSFLGNNDRRTPLGTVGPGRGRCVATGNREFLLKFYAVQLSKEGVVSGFLQVQSNLTLSESGDEFTGRAQWVVFDGNWAVVFRGTSEVAATRLDTPSQE
jgi:hypothetical protein